MKGARSSRSIALVGRGNTDKLPPPAGNEVDAFLETLDHPLRDDIARVRRWVLDAAPSVAEAVHWSSPSVRVGVGVKARLFSLLVRAPLRSNARRGRAR